jgi:hypothetical protein
MIQTPVSSLGRPTIIQTPVSGLGRLTMIQTTVSKSLVLYESNIPDHPQCVHRIHNPEAVGSIQPPLPMNCPKGWFFIAVKRLGLITLGSLA